jgi:hypothetical protein
LNYPANAALIRSDVTPSCRLASKHFADQG